MTPYQTARWDDARWFGQAPCGCARRTVESFCSGAAWDERVDICAAHLRGWRERPRAWRNAVCEGHGIHDADPTVYGAVPFGWRVAGALEAFLRSCAEQPR